LEGSGRATSRVMCQRGKPTCENRNFHNFLCGKCVIHT
jgi:hypothetical protein